MTLARTTSTPSTPDAVEKPFEPGTTGWSAADLDDPRIEREWLGGRYEIVEGVLATMPAAYFSGGEAVENLIFLLKAHLRPQGIRGGFAQEVDIILNDSRVLRADAVYMAPEVKNRLAAAARAAGRRDLRRTRILIPPTLVIESISLGHERHDEQTKRRWYAEFGIPHYWLFNTSNLSLRCLALVEPEGAEAVSYRVDAEGRGEEEVRPSLFPGLVIPLAEVWEE
jgi:Uma2 family endonuclease